MKTAMNSYPFAVYAETKKSAKTGKDYQSISVKFTTKDANGKAQSTYFNFVDKRLLLVLANLCQIGYMDITQTETRERFGDKKGKSEPDENVEFKDDDLDSVPF